MGAAQHLAAFLLVVRVESWGLFLPNVILNELSVTPIFSASCLCVMFFNLHKFLMLLRIFMFYFGLKNDAKIQNKIELLTQYE